ncbi:co-chaperone YbbN [Nesterenkonia haasae]|uniref:co-chaperone YbbN n=1 Tax=Nesterenkonia haasae TaxID=2587813 RepID=UPI0013907D37|nr:tetratricopeptide repeat protein [Nesterenkonia haasae]NDK30337.1 tetratricopeptide repeat protein [Nesterenkonia haasae]
MNDNPSANDRSVNAHGAVDLSGLAEESAPAPRTDQQSPGTQDSWVVAVAPQQLQQIVQLSAQVPALVLIHGDDVTSEQFVSTLEKAVDAHQGRIVMATINAASAPEIAEQAGKLPVVTAFLSGQPIGEFDSSAPVDQLSEVVGQILQLATQNGVTGTVPPQSQRGGQEQEAEPELPPLHRKAHEALESGDYDGAADAFAEALKEKPDDAEAKLGLARVQLMKRTQDVDVAAVRQRAADNMDDVQAQTDVADVDVLGGHVEDAFQRLIRYIQTHPGEGRETARKHLVELFSIVGDQDPRVATARKKLATALF